MATFAADDILTLRPAGPDPAMARAVRLYGEAQRHSRIVRRLRKLIPVVCAGAIGILILAPYLNPFRNFGGLSLGPISLSGSRVTMDSPKLTGFRKDNKPYELTAKTAMQDIRKPNQIELNEMVGRVLMDPDSWANLEASVGFYDSQKEQMLLRGGVKVRTDAGYDVRLKSADIDFKAGTIFSREPVHVVSGGTTIDADALDVTDNGKTVSFKGQVKALIENSGVQISPTANKDAPRGEKAP